MPGLSLPGINQMEVDHHYLYLSLLESRDSLLRIINLIDEEQLGYLIPAGDGPGEIQAINDFQFFNGRFVAYDPVSLHLATIEIPESGLALWKTEGVNKYPVAGIPVLRAFLFQGFPLALYFMADQQKRFAKFDPLSDRISFQGAYPLENQYSEKDQRVLDVLNETIPRVAPDGEKLVLAYEKADLVEIYDKDLRIIGSVRGPDGIELAEMLLLPLCYGYHRFG